mgnify:CR=1 FL=1|jgi:hypothetical protein
MTFQDDLVIMLHEKRIEYDKLFLEAEGIIKELQQERDDYKKALNEVVVLGSMNCSCSEFAKQTLNKYKGKDNANS